MLRCTNKGCGQDFDADSNASDACVYHTGAPIFHEGLKSWSCCQDVSKPVLDFDEFMKIPGCAKGQHTSNKVQEATRPSPLVASASPGEPEVSQSKPQIAASSSIQTFASTLSQAALPEPPVSEEEEGEDLSVTVTPGTACRHKGCGKAFISDEVSRVGEGEEAICMYHPKAPIFHEGSKGYLCCKRRVLEFEEFLKIEGCKIGRHLFALKTKNPMAEQFTECRIDHYQTPSEVHVSVFAKQVDKERSTIKIEADQILLDLHLPQSKRFKRVIELYGPVDADASSFKYFGTKVELTLRKRDARSWAVLEKTDRAVPLNLTFGVGGRTGTIGAKELILDNQNARRVNSP